MVKESKGNGNSGVMESNVRDHDHDQLLSSPGVHLSVDGQITGILITSNLTNYNINMILHVQLLVIDRKNAISNHADDN